MFQWTKIRNIVKYNKDGPNIGRDIRRYDRRYNQINSHVIVERSAGGMWRAINHTMIRNHRRGIRIFVLKILNDYKSKFFKNLVQ